MVQKRNPTNQSGFFFYMDGDHSGISLSPTPCRLFNLLCFINKRCLPSSGLPDRRRANLRTLLLLNSKRVRSLTVTKRIARRNSRAILLVHHQGLEPWTP